MNLIKFSPLIIVFVFLSCIKKKEVDYLIASRIEKGNTNQYGYKDQDGKIIVPYGKYSFCYTDTIKDIGFVLIPKKGIWAIDKNDKQLFAVYNFDNGPDYQRMGVFRILNNDGLIGFSNVKGNIVISPRFEYINPYHENGMASFCENCNFTKQHELGGGTPYAAPKKHVVEALQTKWGCINLKGDTVIKPKYDRIVFTDYDLTIGLIDSKKVFYDNEGRQLEFDRHKFPGVDTAKFNLN